jgi:hypothetical protein
MENDGTPGSADVIVAVACARALSGEHVAKVGRPFCRRKG